MAGEFQTYGGYSLSGIAVLELDFYSNTDYDYIVVDGNLSGSGVLEIDGGTIQIKADAGYTPSNEEVYNILRVTNGATISVISDPTITYVDAGGTPIAPNPFAGSDVSTGNVTASIAASLTESKKYVEYDIQTRKFKRTVDVSEIAKAHGGGGHKNAAGFEILHEK